MENIKDLRKLDTKKLTETLGTKRHELLDKKIMYTVGKSKDTSVFVKLKKEIARIMTVLKEKEILLSTEKEIVNQVKGGSNG